LGRGDNSEYHACGVGDIGAIFNFRVERMVGIEQGIKLYAELGERYNQEHSMLRMVETV